MTKEPHQSRTMRFVPHRILRLLRSVQEVFITKRHLAEADLYEAPLTNFGRNAVERYFTPEQIRGLVQMTDRLTA